MILLLAPAGRAGVVQTPSGNYAIDANGFVSVEAEYIDELLAAGFLLPTQANLQQRPAANGLSAFHLPLTLARKPDGSAIAAAASAGILGLASTLGTSLALVGVAAQNNTKTDSAFFEFVLPVNYVAGQNVTVTVNAGFSGDGTAGTKTVDVSAYEVSNAGAQGADLCATAAQAIASTAADYAFVITGTGFVPGDRILVKVTTALQETGDVSTITAAIGSVRIS